MMLHLIIFMIAWVVTEGGQPIDVSDIRVKGLQLIRPTKISGERMVWHEEESESESDSDSDAAPSPPPGPQ